MEKVEIRKNNYQPMRCRSVNAVCYLCGNKTGSPTWRRLDECTNVPLCEKCVRRKSS